MTILDLLLKAAGAPVARLIEVLEAAAVKAPDLAGEIGGIVAALKSAASTENLVKLASELPAEIANIARGKLAPRDHPRDLA